MASYILINIAYHIGAISPQADDTLTFTVSGELVNDGNGFAGRDTLKIILP